MSTSVDLEQRIALRSKGRKLHIDLKRMRYANQMLMESIPQCNRRRVLYVGIGHGHDALLNLLEGNVQRIVGVDPYLGNGGKGEKDYKELLGLIEHYGLQERIDIVRTTIQEFLKTNETLYDLVVMNDVLHHMFVTKLPLSRSELFESTVEFFKSLEGRVSDSGVMVISDVQRTGIRPWLSRVRVLRGNVNYSTKQNWYEWRRAADETSWVFTLCKKYLPWALRKYGVLCFGSLGLYTVSARYYLYFRRNRDV